MKGRVTNLEARLEVSFLGPQDGETTEVVVDTGFSGHLELSSIKVDALGLQRIDGMEAQLADGSSVLLDVYAALIQWQGFEVEVTVLATGDRPLLGTGLLAGWAFRAEFVEGGLVAVDALE